MPRPVECQWICVCVGSSAVTVSKFKGGERKCSTDNRVFNVSATPVEHFFLPCMAIRYLYLILYEADGLPTVIAEKLGSLG